MIGSLYCAFSEMDAIADAAYVCAFWLPMRTSVTSGTMAPALTICCWKSLLFAAITASVAEAWIWPPSVPVASIPTRCLMAPAFTIRAALSVFEFASTSSK